MTDSLFTGLKVIDCASWIAGPAAATMLSDFGADVIKIEPPGAGDPWRASTPIPGKKVDYYWQLSSRNKRSLALDLKHPDGQAVLHRLVTSADVFITNFPLPVRDRLGMAAADLMPLNPRLIYGSFTAYGEEGEEAAKTGFDSTAYWARTGLMDMVRADPDTVPTRSMPGMGDHPSATGLYAAIVTALYRREKTGQGGVVRSSLLQSGLWANACAVQTRLFGEDVTFRPHRDHAPNALANHYQARDGRWFIMALFNEQRQLRSFLSAIGREELTDDPRFATPDARKTAWPRTGNDPGRGVLQTGSGRMAHHSGQRRRHLRHRRHGKRGVGRSADAPLRRAGAICRRAASDRDDAIPYRWRRQDPGSASTLRRPA